MPNVQPIPEGYPRLSPYLTVRGGAAAIDFYVNVLGATERMRMPAPGDTIGHAELQLGDSLIMLADEPEDGTAPGPATLGSVGLLLHVYVEVVDATFEKAIAAGAKEVQPATDHFYGDRSAIIEDPFGYRWNLSAHVEDVSPEEMEKRMAEFMQSA